MMNRSWTVLEGYCDANWDGEGEYFHARSAEMRFGRARGREGVVMVFRGLEGLLLWARRGRINKAGQWHDEKYEVFAATHEEQATIVPKTMLLGGMPEQIAQA